MNTATHRELNGFSPIGIFWHRLQISPYALSAWRVRSQDFTTVRSDRKSSPTGPTEAAPQDPEHHHDGEV